MKNIVLSMALTAGLTGFMPSQQANAQTLACGNQYTVAAGDSLSNIARRVYGDVARFTALYNANTNTIGANPGVIEIGMVLDLPCLDAQGDARRVVEVVRPRGTTEALPAPETGEIRLVTADDWAPFTNESHPTGGLAVEVANVALTVAYGKPNFKIDFINDWGAHLQPLISDHAYDFSLVWLRPNCDVLERLSDDSKFRCNNLDWSDPIFQQIIGYYTRVGEPAPADYQALFGKRVCRPSGYATFMLEEVGLVDPNIKLIRPNRTTDCFDALVNGEVDAVVLASDVAEGAITNIGAKDKVAFHDHLSQVATMHAVIAKTHPRREQLLATLNSGLDRVKKSGDWFRIISRHMSEHRSKTRQ